jgi:anti-sigma factor ChrR (cupin superfamily)
MQIHADLNRRVAIDTHAVEWVDSPSRGVQRKMLDRDGAEVARATSIVRYAPGSSFPTHQHELGEEIFVLDGDFHDEAGSHGPGTFIRNPPGSSHAPGSVNGCTLFVKLRHVHPDDLQQVAIDTTTAPWRPGLVDGLGVLPLCEFRTQHTALVRWAPGTRFQAHRHWGGEEVYVIDGTFEDEYGRYPAGHWIRSPHLSQHRPFSREGCTILVKTGHLFSSLDRTAAG